MIGAANGKVNASALSEIVSIEESSALVVRDTKFLNPDGNIDWNTWAPDGGRVPGTIKKGQKLEIGMVIDRYGNPHGKYASPLGVPYDQRALPYVENGSAYHQYKVLKPINDVVVSQIAKAFEQPGGGIQYELSASIHKLIKEGYLKKVVE